MKTAFLIAALALLANAQQSVDQHHAGVVVRGDKVMGFSHDKTTHHFRLLKDGGAIEVVANNASDAESRQEIRGHLQHIAAMFKEGNFNAPMLIHAQSPPGVTTMKKLRSEIRYEVQETPDGARVRVSSENPKAIAAIHDFLRFQIRDHQTGDATTVGADQ
jgi:hypothetical protein